MAVRQLSSARSSHLCIVLVKHFECPRLILQRVVPIEVAVNREQRVDDGLCARAVQGADHFDIGGVGGELERSRDVR